MSQTASPFREIYKKQLDSTLIDILRKPQDYQPEAVIAAKEELTVRGIDIQSISPNEPSKEIEVSKDDSWLKQGLSFIDKNETDFENASSAAFPGNSTHALKWETILVFWIVFFAFMIVVALMQSKDLLKNRLSSTSILIIVTTILIPIFQLLSSIAFHQKKRFGLHLFVISMIMLTSNVFMDLFQILKLNIIGYNTSMKYYRVFVLEAAFPLLAVLTLLRIEKSSLPELFHMNRTKAVQKYLTIMAVILVGFYFQKTILYRIDFWYSDTFEDFYSPADIESDEPSAPYE
jgi:hypothetical protein